MVTGDMGEVRHLVATGADPVRKAGVESHAKQLSLVLRHHRDQVDELNAVIGTLSGAIQAVLKDDLCRLGWWWEHGIDAPGIEAKPRADFWHPDAGGIVCEVERGGVTTNGHDLKDLYKAHLDPATKHLFIVVSDWMPTKKGTPRTGAARNVERRLAGFFGEERREVDLETLWAFPYGGPLDR